MKENGISVKLKVRTLIDLDLVFVILSTNDCVQPLRVMRDLRGSPGLGIMHITLSHIPLQYCGIKMVVPLAQVICVPQTTLRNELLLPQKSTVDNGCPILVMSL